MGRALLDTTNSYDPDTLRLLGRAFDGVWQDVGGNYGTAATKDRRTRLALIILELVNNGERDVTEIKASALEIMRLKERPETFNGSSSPQQVSKTDR